MRISALPAGVMERFHSTPAAWAKDISKDFPGSLVVWVKGMPHVPPR